VTGANSRAIQQQVLQEQLEQLGRQYRAEIQSSATASGALQVRAEQEAERIAAQMDAVSKKIDELKLAPADPAHHEDRGPEKADVHDLFRQNLNRIDFRDVARMIRRLLDTDGADGRAGLFLLQSCGLMNGRRCRERIINLLKSEANELLEHLPISARDVERNDRVMLLRKLAQYRDMDLASKAGPEEIATVSRALCSSLQAGSIMLIDVSQCDLVLGDEPEALAWFVQSLWQPLVGELDEAAGRLPGSVTLIGALFFDAKLPAHTLPPEHCCTIDNPVRERLLNIELKRWSRQEISDWLARWGMPGHPPEDVARIADLVMKASDNGLPVAVEHALLDYCKPMPATAG
jgi:hypothetical protein